MEFPSIVFLVLLALSVIIVPLIFALVFAWVFDNSKSIKYQKEMSETLRQIQSELNALKR